MDAVVCYTEPFEVFTSRNYTGKTEATSLTRAFAIQGAVIMSRRYKGFGMDDSQGSTAKNDDDDEDDD